MLVDAAETGACGPAAACVAEDFGLTPPLNSGVPGLGGATRPSREIGSS
jgi:hypothetical protein